MMKDKPSCGQSTRRQWSMATCRPRIELRFLRLCAIDFVSFVYLQRRLSPVPGTSINGYSCWNKKREDRCDSYQWSCRRPLIKLIKISFQTTGCWSVGELGWLITKKVML